MCNSTIHRGTRVGTADWVHWIRRLSLQGQNCPPPPPPPFNKCQSALGSQFCPTLILASNQMNIIPERQASSDKLSLAGQPAQGAPPFSSSSTTVSFHCCPAVGTCSASPSACLHTSASAACCREQNTSTQLSGAALRSDCREGN